MKQKLRNIKKKWEAIIRVRAIMRYMMRVRDGVRGSEEWRGREGEDPKIEFIKRETKRHNYYIPMHSKDSR